MVRLLVVALVRAGKIEATSKGQTIDSALSVEARGTFENNNLFRQTSFRPKKGVEFEDLLKAAEAFKSASARSCPSWSRARRRLRSATRPPATSRPSRSLHTRLLTQRLTGTEVLGKALEQLRAIRSGTEESAVIAFNGCHSELKEAIKRAAELDQALTEPALHDLKRARAALETPWAFLQAEPDLGEDVRDAALRLEDTLKRETFFRELPSIDQLARRGRGRLQPLPPERPLRAGRCLYPGPQDASVNARLGRAR